MNTCERSAEAENAWNPNAPVKMIVLRKTSCEMGESLSSNVPFCLSLDATAACAKSAASPASKPKKRGIAPPAYTTREMDFAPKWPPRLLSPPSRPSPHSGRRRISALSLGRRAASSSTASEKRRKFASVTTAHFPARLGTSATSLAVEIGAWKGARSTAPQMRSVK